MKSNIVCAVLVSTAAAAVLGLIVGISSLLTSAEAQTCRGGGKVFAGFEATSPPLPEPPMTFLEGDRRRSLAEFRGRGVVLNFWATWCGPCVREMPALDRLHAEGGDDFQVLALSSDRGGAPVVAEFYAKNRIVNLLNLIDEKRRVMRSMKVRGLPTTILINGAGEEIGRVIGPAEWDAPEVIAFLRDCLGKRRESPRKPA